MGRTAAASKEVKKKRKEEQKERWTGRQSPTFDWLLNGASSLKRNCLMSVVLLCNISTEGIHVYDQGGIQTWALQETGTGHAYKH